MKNTAIPGRSHESRLKPPSEGGHARAVTMRPVPAVKRSIDILFHLGKSDEPPGVSSIARSLGIVPSSCLHILRELALGGLVHFDAARKTYSLGPGILTLARAVHKKDLFVERAQDCIERIGAEFGVKATASVYDGHGHIVVVASTQEDDDVHIHIPVGRRTPMLASATGRLVAAYGDMSIAELKEAFAKVRWQNAISFKQWQAEVDVARTQGMAIDDGCYRRGITIIATPVFGSDGVPDKFIGALAVTGLLNAKSKRELVEALKDGAAQLGLELGGGRPQNAPGVLPKKR